MDQLSFFICQESCRNSRSRHRYIVTQMQPVKGFSFESSKPILFLSFLFFRGAEQRGCWACSCARQSRICRESQSARPSTPSSLFLLTGTSFPPPFQSSSHSSGLLSLFRSFSDSQFKDPHGFSLLPSHGKGCTQPFRPFPLPAACCLCAASTPSFGNTRLCDPESFTSALISHGTGFSRFVIRSDVK